VKFPPLPASSLPLLRMVSFSKHHGCAYPTLHLQSNATVSDVMWEVFNLKGATAQ
jgi:hypothetical protein